MIMYMKIYSLACMQCICECNICVSKYANSTVFGCLQFSNTLSQVFLLFRWRRCCCYNYQINIYVDIHGNIEPMHARITKTHVLRVEFYLYAYNPCLEVVQQWRKKCNDLVWKSFYKIMTATHTIGQNSQSRNSCASSRF